MVSWIQALMGMFFMFACGLGILSLLTNKFETAWNKVFGLAFLGCVFAGGALLAWPLIALVTYGSSAAREILAAREAARSADIAEEGDSLSRGMYIAGILNAVAAPFLARSILRENPRSIRAWLLLFAVPIGFLLALPILGRALGVTVPKNALIAWFAGSASRPTGTLTFVLWVETIWLLMIFTDHTTAMPLGIITIALTPFAMLPYWIGYYRQVHWTVQALLWAACLFLGFIINVVQQVENAWERQKRDHREKQFLKKLLESFKGSTYPEFSLYLRPFCSTGTLDTQGRIGGAAEPLDLETVLAKAVAPRLRLLALSRPTEAEVIGADRLYLPDTGWWPPFQKLALRATNIFLLPSQHQGTLHEIQWLFGQGHLKKCIFIMPETPSGGGWKRQIVVTIPKAVVMTENPDIDHASNWRLAVNAVKEETGVALPEYDERGAVFTLNTDGSLRAREALGLSRSFFRVGNLRKALQAVRAC
jgi:hypothetical protein